MPKVSDITSSGIPPSFLSPPLQNNISSKKGSSSNVLTGSTSPVGGHSSSYEAGEAAGVDNSLGGTTGVSFRLHTLSQGGF